MLHKIRFTGWEKPLARLIQHPVRRGDQWWSEWIIEPATVEALPDILKIEEACFSAPWTRRMLEAELSGNPFANFLVAKRILPGDVDSVSIIGYLCFWVVLRKYG